MGQLVPVAILWVLTQVCPMLLGQKLHNMCTHSATVRHLQLLLCINPNCRVFEMPAFAVHNSWYNKTFHEVQSKDRWPSLEMVT